MSKNNNIGTWLQKLKFRYYLSDFARLDIEAEHNSGSETGNDARHILETRQFNDLYQKAYDALPAYRKQLSRIKKNLSQIHQYREVLKEESVAQNIKENILHRFYSRKKTQQAQKAPGFFQKLRDRYYFDGTMIFPMLRYFAGFSVVIFLTFATLYWGRVHLGNETNDTVSKTYVQQSSPEPVLPLKMYNVKDHKVLNLSANNIRIKNRSSEVRVYSFSDQKENNQISHRMQFLTLHPGAAISIGRRHNKIQVTHDDGILYYFADKSANLEFIAGKVKFIPVGTKFLAEKNKKESYKLGVISGQVKAGVTGTIEQLVTIDQGQAVVFENFKKSPVIKPGSLETESSRRAHLAHKMAVLELRKELPLLMQRQNAFDVFEYPVEGTLDKVVTQNSAGENQSKATLNYIKKITPVKTKSEESSVTQKTVKPGVVSQQPDINSKAASQKNKLAITLRTKDGRTISGEILDLSTIAIRVKTANGIFTARLSSIEEMQMIE